MKFGTGGVFECSDDQYNKLPHIILSFKNGTEREQQGSVVLVKELYAQRDKETDQCRLQISNHGMDDKPNYWIVGVKFLRFFYTVYKVDE